MGYWENEENDMKKLSFWALAWMIGLLLGACSNDEKTPFLSSVSLKYDKVELNVGDTLQLDCSIMPEEITPVLHWYSLDTTVVTVDEVGMLFGIRMGNAMVIVEAMDEGIVVKDTCKVQVSNVDAGFIQLSEHEKTLDVDESFILSYKIEPENTTDKRVRWYVDNPNIVSVDDGKVTALAAGDARIAVTVIASGVSDVCSVHVNPVEVTEIILSETEVELEKNRGITLTATVLPENATDKTITWTSSDEAIATVQNNGTVIAYAEGECEITATSVDGKVTATCQVTVIPVKVTGVTLDLPEKILLGDEFPVTYQMLPLDADNQAVRIESSDESVIKVVDGIAIRAMKMGEATITVITEEGGFTSSSVVRVAEITEFVVARITSSSIMNMDGYCSGSIYSTLYNNSNRDITLTRMEIRDTEYDWVVSYTDDPSLLGMVPAHQSSNNLGSRKLRDVYMPRIVWYFIYEGKSYETSVQYESHS